MELVLGLPCWKKARFYHVDSEANNKGILIPRLTTNEINGIVDPIDGLLVYDTLKQGFVCWDSSLLNDLLSRPSEKWVEITLKYDNNVARSGTPNGWTLCNRDNGTPDLRGKFIIDAGQSQNP